MLLRFGASNFRSLKVYQELSLSASGLKEVAFGGIVPAGRLGGILPVIVIYGANASGKSNVVSAVRYFCEAVLYSHTKGAADGGMPRDHFALDTGMLQADSRFDCDILVEGIRYHYGFVIDDAGVKEEWLYAFPRGKRQIWFHRHADETDPFYFGKFLGGQNKIIADLTRGNSLFLSAAAQNNHRQLLPIYGFFADNMVFRFPDDEADDDEIIEFMEDDAIRRRALAFLKSADVGIVDAAVHEAIVPGQFASLFSYNGQGVSCPSTMRMAGRSRFRRPRSWSGSAIAVRMATASS